MYEYLAYVLAHLFYVLTLPPPPPTFFPYTTLFRPNSLELMQSRLPDVRLLGGKIDKEHRFNYSVTSIDTLKRMSFNTAFFGTSNVKEDGAYLTKMSDTELTRVAASRAKQVVVIAENYKFNSQNTSPFMRSEERRVGKEWRSVWAPLP